MTQSPQEEKEWQVFLRENRPTPPPAAKDLEEQLMKAIAISNRPVRKRRLWAISSTIAASLLMAWGGYHFLGISQDSTNYASLENFMENNWNEVVGEVPASLPSNASQADWLLETNTTK